MLFDRSGDNLPVLDLPGFPFARATIAPHS
jgi:hypothetical protein